MTAPRRRDERQIEQGRREDSRREGWRMQEEGGRCREGRRRGKRPDEGGGKGGF